MFKNLSCARMLARYMLIAAASFNPAFSFAGHAPTTLTTTPQPLAVGMVLVGPRNEPGWSYQHHQGLLAMQKTLGTAVKTTVVDNVSEGADAERVIRELAHSGHALILTTSFGYMEPTLRVAAEFPNIRFVHVSGYKTAANVAAVNARFYEGRYLAGLVAGKASKSGTLGYVAAFPIPEVVQGINAFTLGARAANPKAQVRVVWTASWFDPGKERDAALALIAREADVLAYHTGSLAVPQVAQEKNVGLISYHTDVHTLAPKAQLVAVTHWWDAYYTNAAQQVLRGTWKADAQLHGIHNGAVKLTGWHINTPIATQQWVQTQAQQIASGTLHPFTGPIKDNTGTLRWEKGTLLHEALTKMNYLVEGVVGSLPQ
jgi:basic membrane protein A and related proteins